MPIIYLHIGTHKTGTTSIQRFLSQNRDNLLKEGSLFPYSGRSKPLSGHHVLAWSILGINGVTDEQCWKKLFGEIQEVKPEKVILSAEGFGASNLEQIQRIKKYFSNQDVRVIVYFRNQFSYLLSDYKETIKAGKYSLSFKEYINKRVERCNYPKLIQLWIDIFGKENINIRLFDKAKEEPGLISDFLQMVGIDPSGFSEKNKIRINISPSDEIVLLLRNLNRAEEKLDHELFQKPFRVLRKTILGQNKFFVTAAKINSKFSNQKIYYEQDLIWLRNKVKPWNEIFFENFVDASEKFYFQF